MINNYAIYFIFLQCSKAEIWSPYSKYYKMSYKSQNYSSVTIWYNFLCIWNSFHSEILSFRPLFKISVYMSYESKDKMEFLAQYLPKDPTMPTRPRKDSDKCLNTKVDTAP